MKSVTFNGKIWGLGPLFTIHTYSIISVMTRGDTYLADGRGFLGLPFTRRDPPRLIVQRYTHSLIGYEWQEPMGRVCGIRFFGTGVFVWQRMRVVIVPHTRPLLSDARAFFFYFSFFFSDNVIDRTKRPRIIFFVIFHSKIIVQIFIFRQLPLCITQRMCYVIATNRKI